jgi:hypothetical protein
MTISGPACTMAGMTTFTNRSRIAARLALAGVAVAGGLVVSSNRAFATGQRQTFVSFETSRHGVNEHGFEAVGPIQGTATEVILSDRFDPGTGVETIKDRFDFPDGSVFATAKIKPGQFRTDPLTCIERNNGTVSIRITGGTNKYAHATGSATGAFTILGLTGRNADGSCNSSQSTERFHDLIAHAKGTASI